MQQQIQQLADSELRGHLEAMQGFAINHNCSFRATNGWMVAEAAGALDALNPMWKVKIRNRQEGARGGREPPLGQETLCPVAQTRPAGQELRIEGVHYEPYSRSCACSTVPALKTSGRVKNNDESEAMVEWDIAGVLRRWHPGVLAGRHGNDRGQRGRRRAGRSSYRPRCGEGGEGHGRRRS